VPRPIWKGAITFGLVYIPVNVHPGSSPEALDLDLLDRRDYAPIGYRRVNKRTGKEVDRADIVKGYEYRKGDYVLVTDADFRQANVKASQTIEIESFVDAAEIGPQYFDEPYHLEPEKRGGKGYALLRETLHRSGRVAIATVVLRTRQHLAAVVPVDRLLVLNTLRFAAELRSPKKLALPGGSLKQAGVSAKELTLARRLVDDMSAPWRPERYRDTYRAALMARIQRKVKSGKVHAVSLPDDAAEPCQSAQVIDLMSLLKRSLDGTGANARRRGPARATADAARPRRRRA
jgi:DNA end-binding protein Ku